MIIEIERHQTLIHHRLPSGCLRCTVFNPMSEAEARRLAPQYGIDPLSIFAIEQSLFRYRRHVDGAQVTEILNRLPYAEKHSPLQLLEAVRSLAPQAVAIVSYWDSPGRR